MSSFLFSCISFKYVLLQALVSEFNCFLRCRCSMEMWCPDDMGRESWDWVGPPAWVRACFNSLRWGGGSSPVKNGASPRLCCCCRRCCFGRVFNRVFVQSCDANAAVSETNWWRVTWERLPATKPPLLCLTQEKLF